ncbi:hypothetical protein [Aquimarina litoralis]|uniref:hypothetical protein n=1 Tax=Aquimarina litoralis TaxID=584605 RepID=UPI001C57A4B0|nr:hypothetical protein [Aquimarina litoralis]MBW1295610.1 hypothetical protein [Aquimarina litoralis]
MKDSISKTSDLLNTFSTISFNQKHKDVWQPVYMSQLYGTFFGVYGKFNFDKESNSIEVDFKTINYKGIINIGIKKAELSKPNRNRIRVKESKLDDPKHINVISFTLKVAGLVVEKEKNDQNPYLNNPFPKSDFSKRKATYTIPEEIDISKDNLYLEIIRELEPLDEGHWSIHGIFDNEHYYRDGQRDPFAWEENSDYMKYTSAKTINPRVDANNRLIDKITQTVQDETGRPKGPGGICPRGYNLITT